MKTYNKETFKRLLEQKLTHQRTTTLEEVSTNDLYYAIASIVQDEINQATNEMKQQNKEARRRQLSYISMEFLIGRLIESNLLNIGLKEVCDAILIELGHDPRDVYNIEHDAGLGNGGLGRLAACFLDSIASLNLVGNGFGIRYRYGLFEQRIVSGNQVELPDHWLKETYPFETRKRDEAVEVNFGGDVEMIVNEESLSFKYHNQETVLAVPYDVGIVGYDTDVVNTLRLWSAELNEQEVSTDYYAYLEKMKNIEKISGFLYPDDSTEEGRFLRLKQQYFLVSATLQTLMNRLTEHYNMQPTDFHKENVIQINDTHPTFGIPELMRILMDDKGLSWDAAWSITTQTFAYTNHTIMQEALEKWPVEQVKKVNPRIYMIIEEINKRFVEEVQSNDQNLNVEELKIINDGMIHMSKLAIVGSFSVNGVAALHSEIIKDHTFNEFYKLTPNKFNNKTNGITHRRWLMTSNPDLTELLIDAIGDDFIKHPNHLIDALRFKNDSAFLRKLSEVKLKNKQILKGVIQKQTGIEVDEHSIFDVQVKRLHEYKRQLMNVFHIIYLYKAIKRNPHIKIIPRTFIFGAKAAPSYHIAKEIIKLIHGVANVVNNDADVNHRLKVVFLENYNVTLAEDIMPAAEISEQISTASMEASGTGNMKMMMNGAITLGTMDGANVEIKELVGDDNIFIFGLSSKEVIDYQQNGGYNAMEIYQSDDRIKEVMDSLKSGEFGDVFNDLYYRVLSDNDPYFVLKDFNNYVEAQMEASTTYEHQDKWQQMSLVNIAKSGKFSSDRTIYEYNRDIWKL